MVCRVCPTNPREEAPGLDPGAVHCDTPTTLHKHDTPEEMVECMRQYGYVRDT